MWQHDFLTLDDLKSGHPLKKGVEVLVLHGDFRRQVFKVDKVTKSNAIVIPATHVCLIESHLERRCTCSKSH